jgi:TPR repeat protein
LYYTAFARRGDCGAQFEIAELWHARGKSPTLARHWYDLAARAGHPDAALKLARLYLGDSPPNFELAFRWSLIAVERGNKSGFKLAKIAERYLPLSQQMKIVKEICLQCDL